MGKYRRVAFEDRCQIRAMLAAKIGVSKVAESLGFHRSSIYRELGRNSVSSGCYRVRPAHQRATLNKQKCRRRLRIQGPLEETILQKLALKWSPLQISGRLSLEQGQRVISHESIYRYIRARPELGESLWRKSLRRYKKSGTGRHQFNKKQGWPWMLSITKRPKSVENRMRYGHWERDTMYGEKRQMMLVCAERKSRYLRLDRVRRPVSIHMAEQTKGLLSNLPRPLLSITNDNGSEFMDAREFELPVYYCKPFKPQQRGTVENLIGLIRQYIPKKSNLELIPQEKIQEIERDLNLRPRKCLNYRTPHEVLFNTFVALAS